jgi:hypothetical protein
MLQQLSVQIDRASLNAKLVKARQQVSDLITFAEDHFDLSYDSTISNVKTRLKESTANLKLDQLVGYIEELIQHRDNILICIDERSEETVNRISKLDSLLDNFGLPKLSAKKSS